jgi:hypothetical protein
MGGGGRGRRLDSHQLTCLSSLSFFILHFHFVSFSFFVFHVSCFKNTSGINSMGSLRKMFGRTARCAKRARVVIG